MNDIARNDSFRLAGHDVLLGIPQGSDDVQQEDELFIVSGRATQKPVRFLNELFGRAVKERARDIHIKQTNTNCRIRFRRSDGKLITVHNLPIETDDQKEWMRLIDEKIRSRAHIALSERRTPQDGRMSLRFAGANIDVRVNVTPGVSDGQLIVCRILDQSNSNKRLDDIEMTTSVREAIKHIIDEPNGLFLITGPTGSGKTTTLYAMLNELNDESRNIVTIENPVEYRIEEFHQMDLNGRDFTFADALRAVLRQDPDIIMVGEIRDHETANIAVQAAITGHLVLSTLHANNAAGAITRLVELGVDPMTLAAALRGVTAQRLVNVIPNREEISWQPPSELEKAWLRANNINRKDPTYPQVDSASDSKGVIPVMEVIVADQRVKKALRQGEMEIYEAASRQPQFETLAQASERLAFAGITTLSEARRTSSIQEAPVIRNKRLGQVLVESGIVDSDEMEKLLALQAQLRMEGHHQRLGQMLIEHDLCTPDQLFEAIGVTAEAQDFLQRVCNTDASRADLSVLVRKWTPGTESLFRMAIENKLVNEEELRNAIQNY